MQVDDVGVGGKYYQIAREVGGRVAAAASPSTNTTTKGILLCGSGMGMAIVANKVAGVRAAVVENEAAAINSRSINDSNVLTLGGACATQRPSANAPTPPSSSSLPPSLSPSVPTTDNTHTHHTHAHIPQPPTAMITKPEEAQRIVDSWLAGEFKGPAPANEGKGWPEEIQGFLTQSLPDIARLEGELQGTAAAAAAAATTTTTTTGSATAATTAATAAGAAAAGYEPPCALCKRAGSDQHPFEAVAGVAGAEWVQVREGGSGGEGRGGEKQTKEAGTGWHCPLFVAPTSGAQIAPLPPPTNQLRENPTRALVRFKAGAVEPAHHHTQGHDVFVMSGRKTVENLSRGESFELGAGSYLYTAGGERHRVTYHEDTEFLIVCDGRFDVTWDEE
jgi:ribose 5-phosphate isomerase RpiB/mannose-6-phosphate isomerase-like protein (cupin superfamily)